MLAMGNTAGAWCFSAPHPFLQLVQAERPAAESSTASSFRAPWCNLEVLQRLAPAKTMVGSEGRWSGFHL